MTIKLKSTNINILGMKTRMPFRYGIAAMTALPHVFVQAEIEINGELHKGFAADGLAPKWFTKNPDTSYQHDIEEMYHVIKSACDIAMKIEKADSVFDFWIAIHEQQRQWGETIGYPPLLWGFGVSMIERALIDALCRANNITFATALANNSLGIKLGMLFPELAEYNPQQLLPEKPNTSFALRHTVGLTDPLKYSDITDEERIRDGLPQSLEECIRAYGLNHFKLKICGDMQKDLDRLKNIATVIDNTVEGEYVFTLDGNEQYKKVANFKEFWEAFSNEPQLKSFLKKMLFVEQPIHRSKALDSDTKAELLNWDSRPPIIIDESDADIYSLPTALDCGYVGTSHKNCKGVLRSIANACLLEYRRRIFKDKTYILSGEDLTNVGPVALLQDLAVAANLGIRHIERNGHHYFRGLTMFPDDIQQLVLKHHPDIYGLNMQDFPSLIIKDGKVDITSAINAPFGLGFYFDTTRFISLADWSYELLK